MSIRTLSRLMLAAVPAIAVLTASAHAQWTVTNLHPIGATSSFARGASGTQQGGQAQVGNATHASVWSGTAASWVDLNPTGSTFSYVFGVGGTQKVGYAVGAGGETQASLWTGTAASWVNLNPAGSTNAQAYGTSGTQQVGSAYFGAELHAGIWSGTAASWVDLNPAGSANSEAYGASATQQVGIVYNGGVSHASLWSGTAASWVDLHPAGSTSSVARSASGTQQVGYAVVDGHDRASLWSGTAASWVDLNPPNSGVSQAYGTSGTQQVGYSIIGGVQRASLWNSTADSWEDLSLVLPGSWGSSWAFSIWNDGLYIHVAGYGYNNATGRQEALLWSRPASAWTVANLHPIGATQSLAWGTSGTQQVGRADVGGVQRASLWSGTAGSWVDLNPAGSTESEARGAAGTQQVGYSIIDNLFHASLWSGTAASRVDLNPAGSTGSNAYGTSGTQQVGIAIIGIGRASLWGGTAASWIDLSPVGATFSVANSASGTQQVGLANVGGVERASLWTGTADSWVDLNPAGSTGSAAYGTSGTQQVGRAIVGGVPRASLWSGTAASWVDLHPAGATESEARGAFGTQQVGLATINGMYHASLWRGTAESWEDLSLALPGSWGHTTAQSIWSDGLNIYVAGYGNNNATQRAEALLWSRPVPCSSIASAIATPSGPFSLGGNVQIQATASGTTPMNFEWRKNNQPLTESADIVGVNSSLLVLTNLTTSSQGDYLCRVSNNCSEQITPPVTFSCRPVFNTQPPSQVTVVNSVTISANAGAPPSVSYRWRRNGQNLLNVPGTYSGVTTATLNILRGDASVAGDYQLVATNGCGSTTSTTATVSCRPTISQQPAAAVSLVGGALLSAGVVAREPLTLQWTRNGATIADAPGRYAGTNSTTLAILSDLPDLAGSYVLTATNECGTAQSAATVVTCSAPVITPPPPATVLLQAGATITAGSPAGTAYQYQWRQEMQPLPEVPGLITGTTTATLSFDAADPSLAGSFDCLVSSACGVTVSSPTLVYCPTDFDRNGLVDPDDLADYLSVYFAIPSDAAADFNQDGTVDPDDLSDFITAFFDGC